MGARLDIMFAERTWHMKLEEAVLEKKKELEICKIKNKEVGIKLKTIKKKIRHFVNFLLLIFEE